MLRDKPLIIFFMIAFLIPIIAVVIVTVIYGLQTGLVTNQLSLTSLIVVLAMVHAPLVAAMISAYVDERAEGLKNLFRGLKHWRFKAEWYVRALLIFPLSILASLLIMSLFSDNYTPAFFISILVVGTFISALWEEVGWTGFATPRMLKRLSPLKVGLSLGFIHWLWHLAADFWGSSAFYEEIYLYAIHALLWLIGLLVLRIITLWIYVRTNSLVLGWLTHFSYTGGQLLLVPLSLTAIETLLWNSVFVILLLFVMLLLLGLNTDFRNYWRSGENWSSDFPG